MESFSTSIKSSHLKVFIQLLMYTVLKRTTFLALGVDILYVTMVMQPCSKDTFNNMAGGLNRTYM